MGSENDRIKNNNERNIEKNKKMINGFLNKIINESDNEIKMDIKSFIGDIIIESEYQIKEERNEKFNKMLQNEKNNQVNLTITNKDNENYTCAIVTNKYHLFRGMSIAKKILNKEVGGIPAKINRFYLLNSMVREFFGVIKDIWKIL